MKSASDNEWPKLLAACRELAELFPEGLVFIGGIAVYFHSGKTPDNFGEFSHDGDFLMSLADFADLRDLYEVTRNRRLTKHQLIKNGIEFDVYVEHQNNLAVPFDEALCYSEIIDGVRVASLEHLLVLKIDAANARAGTGKGDKDDRDVARIVLLMGEPRMEILDKYLDQNRLHCIKRLIPRPEPFVAIAHGDTKLARDYRDRYRRAAARIVAAIGREGVPDPSDS